MIFVRADVNVALEGENFIRTYVGVVISNKIALCCFPSSITAPFFPQILIKIKESSFVNLDNIILHCINYFSVVEFYANWKTMLKIF